MAKTNKEVKRKKGRPREKPRACLSIYCREEYRLMLKKIAVEEKTTLTDLVTKIFEDYFKRTEK